MAVSSNPKYRNNRTCFYSEKTTDTLCIGTIIQVLKSDQNSFDHNFTASNIPNNGGTTKYNVEVGDANVETNPDYQYLGYIYCDGSEYNISDYPALYSVIGNLYGGTAATNITKENVFSNWPGELGTFKVPDFKAKRLVGNGPVYGNGTVSVGESGLGVGPSTIDGKWYLDEAGQKEQFTLGRVSTTGYELVTDSVPAQVIGTQTVTVNLAEQRLNGPPQHTHILLHSEAPQDASSPRKSSGDGYLRGYKNSNGRILQYTVPGGQPLVHRHVLAKKPQPDTTVATYDLFNFTAGDSSSGSIKEEGYYFASGKPGFGTTVDVTTIATPTFKKLISSSVIGGRTIVTEGSPVYTYGTPVTYTASGSFSMPATWDNVRITVRGAAGSGAAGSIAGNSGGSSTATIANSYLSMTSTGGGGGGAASASTGGAAGTPGSGSSSGTLVNSSAITAGNSTSNGSGTAATAGSGVKTYIANISGWSPGGTVTQPSSIYGGTGGGFTNSLGSNGTYSYTNSQVTVGPTSYTSGSSPTLSFAAGKLSSLTWSISGARGGSTTTGGGYGKALTISYSTTRLLSTSNGSGFTVNIGGTGSQAGGGSGGGAANGTGAGGGNAGSPNGNGSAGAGGGAGTTIKIGSTVILGAGGGGGAGGASNNGSLAGGTGTASKNTLQSTTSTIGGGQGNQGGSAGCNGGGGGGGGGGIDTSSSAASGGEGGSASGHGPASDGGQQGNSAYRSDYFNAPTSNTDTGTGSASLTYTSEQSFYFPGGGGGASGGEVITTISKTAATAVSAADFSSISFTVGTGGTGVSSGSYSTSNGGNGAVIIRTGVITSYTGGSTSISTGDIIKSASAGVEIYATGTGSGASDGFRLPTHQVPTIEFVPISGGSGATATATVTNSVVSAVSLTAGGTGYTLSAAARFLHGAGSGTTAILTKNATGVISTMSLSSGSSTAYSKYVKFSGSDQTRYIILVAQDCTDVRKLTIKVARGNGVNGGNRPEAGDDLKIYYNTDGTNVFSSTSQFLGIIVPIPTDAEITSNYDGSGSGNEATKWYSYSVDLPEAAQTNGVQFKITQERSQPTSLNDNNGQNTDQFGICDFVYEKKVTTTPTFIPAEGKISTADDTLSYTVSGDPKAYHPSGMSANDITFNLTSAVPIVPIASIDPDINIPLIEPYFLVKHLIKAF